MATSPVSATYIHVYLTSPFGACEDRFRFARAALPHAIQHRGNEASLPSLSDINETHARFAERRDAVLLMLTG